MPINITCPSCGVSLKVSEERIGRPANCPKCKALFTPLNDTHDANDNDVSLPEEQQALSNTVPLTDGLLEQTLASLNKQGNPPGPSVHVTNQLLERIADTLESTANEFTEHVVRNANREQSSDEWEYKVLTQKDKWFTGKFDPEALENALNSYARQGWRVKSTATASFPGFGGAREEIVVILERLRA